MAAMELDVHSTDAATNLPPSTESIFMCSEKDEICHHACNAHDHKIHWSNRTLIENDGEEEFEIDEALAKSVYTILKTFEQKTSNRGSLSTEFLEEAQVDLINSLEDALVDHYLQEYRREAIENGLFIEDDEEELDPNSPEDVQAIAVNMDILDEEEPFIEDDEEEMDQSGQEDFQTIAINMYL